MEKQTVKKIVNGLDVEQIQGMVDAVKKQPQMAQAKFFAKTVWKSGFHNEALVKDFSLGGVKNEKSRPNPFVIVGDHPPELLGTNKEQLQLKYFWQPSDIASRRASLHMALLWAFQ